MRQQNKYAKMVLPIMLVISFACNFLGGEKGDILGEEYTSQVGGFTLRKASGYSFSEVNGIVSMIAPDADAEVGPMIGIIGGHIDGEMSNEELNEQMLDETATMKFGRNKKITINGVKGILTDGSADYGDQQIQGQIFTAMVSPTQQFSLIGYAPRERWKELEPVIAAVLKSITFFEPMGGTNLGTQNGLDAPMSGGNPQLIRQWATYAEASSSYSDTDWSAMQAIGEPDVDVCGDSVKAWASLESDTEEWIELSYDIPVVPTEINIYESYNPSQTVEVQMTDIDGNTYVAWTGVPVSAVECPDRHSILLELDKEIYINKVAIFVDQSVTGWGWAEIDAVELVGTVGGQGVIVQEPSTITGGQSSGAGTNSFTTDGLNSGAFVYAVSGYENEVINNNNVQYQSTDNTYVVALVSETERYMISLFLPKADLKKGLIEMEPYDASQATKKYTAAIYINAFLYTAQSGVFDIQSDPASGKLSGTFSFTAQSKDYPDRNVVIAGAFNDVPLR